MVKESHTEKDPNRNSKGAIKILVPTFLLVLLGFVIAYQFVEPAPPKHISIGTGSETGAYYLYGQRYRDILAQYGVTLEVRSTAGSVENIRLLETEENGVDVAFVQGGIGEPKDSEKISSLASLYFEPLWVFYRNGIQIRQLSDLKDLRVAVGKEGSGTRPVALTLLANNGIKEDAATILPLDGEEAAEALMHAEIDAAFFVISPQSPTIRHLIEDKNISLLSFERAEAYAQIHRYLSKLKLPQGILDFGLNIPPRDIMLLGATANLVACKDLHPALIDLLLQAAEEVHGRGGLFEEVGEFPSRKYLTFPLHKEANRHFKSGPKFLQRFLPFWAATLIDRTKVMLLPLFTLLIPLMKFVPPGYRWRVRYRIFQWYKELQKVDLAATEKDSPQQLDDYIDELHKIEKEVMQVTVPLSYAAELYMLRQHIKHVAERLTAYKISYSSTQ